ncbi:MAG: peptide-methionine (S)-S-oxide reductase MsrA [Alphaproteobacteria bacterium]
MFAIALLVAAAAFSVKAHAAEPAVAIPAAAYDPPSTKASETAILAGGCFWGVQAVFEHIKGVTHVVAGYSGGTLVNPSYEDVTTERTGHAESVQITYDPRQVSYGQLLRVYFSVAHNPTELNRQGPDSGPSYRSNIFYTSKAQQDVATAYVAQLTKAKVFSKPIVTRIDPASTFYPAEEYHQDFLIKNPDYPYIVINDQPKLVNFKRLLPELYSENPVRV